MFAEAQDGEEGKRPPIQKCWSYNVAIVQDAGIAADKAQGYFGTSDGKLSAIDLKTGQPAWSTEVGGKLASEIVVSDKAIYAGSGAAESGGQAVVNSLSPITGLQNWRIRVPTYQRFHLGLGAAGLAIVSGSGDIWLLNEGDGTVVWKSAASGSIASAPRFDNGKLIVATAAKRIEEFSLSDGKRTASLPLKFVPTLVGGGTSAVVYSDEKGAVFSSEPGGGQNWKFKAGGRITYVKPVDDNVLLGSVDNFVYFMSIERGNILWKRRLPGRIASGGLIGEKLAAFTVVGEPSAFVIDLESGRVVDQLALAGEDSFLLTPIRANGIYLLAATGTGISAFSTACANEKRGT